MITKFKIFENNSIITSIELYDSLHYGTIDKLKELLAKKPNLDEPYFDNFSVGGYLLFKVADSTSISFVLSAFVELTNAGANWFEKNHFGKYFLDYLSGDILSKLKELFPDKYDVYIALKEVEKYHL